jgi:single-strand selective monofunctional uracil DNA glycosylase
VIEKFKKDFITASKILSDKVDSLKFNDASLTIYNPLAYASNINEIYINKYLNKDIDGIFLGMNPGPFGMAQTGVPFGDIEMVRDWLDISGKVSKPKFEHLKRPITGFDCKKREISGSRLWGWAKSRYLDPKVFFKKYFVWNYCPLVFMEKSGANKTPDKLLPNDRKILFEFCDETLRELVKLTSTKSVIGVGKFARKRAEVALGDQVEISDILHPSPASPKANKNWVGEIEKQLTDFGILS